MAVRDFFYEATGVNKKVVRFVSYTFLLSSAFVLGYASRMPNSRRTFEKRTGKAHYYANLIDEILIALDRPNDHVTDNTRYLELEPDANRRAMVASELGIYPAEPTELIVDMARRLRIYRKEIDRLAEAAKKSPKAKWLRTPHLNFRAELFGYKMVAFKKPDETWRFLVAFKRGESVWTGSEELDSAQTAMAHAETFVYHQLVTLREIGALYREIDKKVVSLRAPHGTIRVKGKPYVSGEHLSKLSQQDT